MNVVFVGASKFGLRCLDLVRQHTACQVVGVVTAPQKFTISYRPDGVTNVLHADVIAYCDKHQLPFVVITEGMKSSGVMAQIQAWKPDIFIVSGWYHMIPKSWRNLAPAYGLHASLLPDYSGGAPLVWAIINGEEKTGITLFQLADGVDNGPVIAQARTTIYEDDTIATLYARIEDIGLQLLEKNLPALAAGTAHHTIQDERLRRVFPQRGPEDGEIGWAHDARSIVNFIRAQTRPYPGAFTTWKGKHLMIWESRLAIGTGEIDAVPGQVHFSPITTLVQTGQGAVEILDASYEEQIFNGTELRAILKEGGILGNPDKI